MTIGKKLWAQIMFAKERRLLQLLLNTIVVLIVMAAILVQPNLGDFWDKSVGTISSIATFFIAIFLWFNDLSRDWKDSLEKRLSVDYCFINAKGEVQVAMRCVGAYLSGEADIRQWGQQIGKQMNNNELLSFNPLPFQMSLTPLFDEREGHFYKPYYLVIMLDTDTGRLPKISQKLMPSIKDNKMLIWTRQNGMTNEWVEAQSSPSTDASAR